MEASWDDNATVLVGQKGTFFVSCLGQEVLMILESEKSEFCKSITRLPLSRIRFFYLVLLTQNFRKATILSQIV